MNAYLFYRRIRGPVFLLTFGVTALLAEWDVLSFAQSWPLYLIVFGVLRLAEGTALTVAPPYYPAQSYPSQSYSGQGYAGYSSGPYRQPGSPPSAPGTGLATVQPAPIQTSTSIEEES